MVSMIFFGVQRKEAIWLRMAGVPRVVADGLAQVWQQKRRYEPEGYDDIRSWVNQLTDNDWEKAIPNWTKSRSTGQSSRTNGNFTLVLQYSYNF